MDSSQLVRDLEAGPATVPVLDVHTHRVGGRLGARGLHDVLLNHIVSATCMPRDVRLERD